MYCLNRIDFASSDNAISQINIGGMRLNNSKTPYGYVTSWTDRDYEKSNRTRIIGGKNGSGKTYLLKAIELVCNLLQKNKITLEQILSILEKKGKTKTFKKKHNYFNAGKTNFVNHYEYLFITKI